MFSLKEAKVDFLNDFGVFGPFQCSSIEDGDQILKVFPCNISNFSQSVWPMMATYWKLLKIHKCFLNFVAGCVNKKRHIVSVQNCSYITILVVVMVMVYSEEWFRNIVLGYLICSSFFGLNIKSKVC